MSNHITTYDSLEQDGVIHALAEACVQAMHDTAAAATAQRFIRLCAHQVAGAGDMTAERVAAHLQTTLNGIKASASELHFAEGAGRT